MRRYLAALAVVVIALAATPAFAGKPLASYTITLTCPAGTYSYITNVALRDSNGNVVSPTGYALECGTSPFGSTPNGYPSNRTCLHVGQGNSGDCGPVVLRGQPKWRWHRWWHLLWWLWICEGPEADRRVVPQRCGHQADHQLTAPHSQPIVWKARSGGPSYARPQTPLPAGPTCQTSPALTASAYCANSQRDRAGGYGARSRATTAQKSTQRA